MNDNITEFPKKQPVKREPLGVKEIECIGFLNTHDREIWIDDPVSIAKICAFIVREKITLKEELP